MADSTKLQWILLLKSELRQAQEHERRWKWLGEQLHKTDDEMWKATAQIRRLEVKKLKLLIQQEEPSHKG
jgi:hypothetical protein